MLQGYYVIRFGNRHNISIRDRYYNKPEKRRITAAWCRLFDVIISSTKIKKEHVLCSCFSVSMSALQSVLPIGVWRVQRCYYVTTTPWCCRHFHSAFLRTARQSCSQGSLATERKSPRMHSIASLIHSNLSITLSVQFLCCYHWDFFVNSSKAWGQ